MLLYYSFLILSIEESYYLQEKKMHIPSNVYFDYLSPIELYEKKEGYYF